ncbi:hypothetical protein RirG_111720 [Rhizophagus irregularis DAOM 197198w]|uniref:Uncharacterized protein n=1 Tax=Rhizophagus irregularis (strain DAOM 197198w) TaxID=1432141 RepID=A0A015MLP6_RHIIW|nr:hypothetical protein RirG_111720 [Rhizophagus irregularis DAOM 197198w]
MFIKIELLDAEIFTKNDFLSFSKKGCFWPKVHYDLYIRYPGSYCYPGQVQFFFSHKVDLPDGELEHNLAFIRWYQPANSRYYFSIEDDEICNVELWGTKFYPEGQDCIIPVHNILSRFVPIKYKISDRKNAREYLAVNPINRKFNIR